MSDFASQLQTHLQAMPQRSPSDDAILGILTAPDSNKKERQLRRMERHARRHLGFGDTEQLDWSTLDWSKLLGVLLQILGAILPWLLAL